MGIESIRQAEIEPTVLTLYPQHLHTTIATQMKMGARVAATEAGLAQGSNGQFLYCQMCLPADDWLRAGEDLVTSPAWLFCLDKGGGCVSAVLSTTGRRCRDSSIIMDHCL